ncbi:anthranilate phosphoribosyltransferase [Buchnera aphidicola]|uniref:Anthranilate phosphoribosyltransferase n=1 Tax=Buchnera aphidicola (Anoecia oenotherae) TaxID=1241833 RepID=A0A4D6Y4J9_9GAMM|nr:anthranilate phosphoribosyltransferase [Buchnera aphidicola]QCI19345.1 anthranilate phosphoribosyltransferase [Buchnera aphidicola (Anoecia oenotherae)]
MDKKIKKILNSKYINQNEIYNLFHNIVLDKFNSEQLSSILSSMNLEENNLYELIIGSTKEILKYSKPFLKPTYLFADIVGTGGDQSNTINISTTSAFVTSSCGFKIAKHCNTNITGLSGSANLLDSFKINLYSSPENSLHLLDKFNLCFLYFPHYYNFFKRISKIRKRLKTKTIFNIIGPLLNPAKPPLIVVGVYSKNIIIPMINAIKFFKYKHAIVIHSSGTDEVTLHDTTYVAELKNNNISFYELNPTDFGIKKHSENFAIGGNTSKNADIIKNIIKGKSNLAIEQIIAANVAIVLKVFGYSNLKKNTSLALHAIQSGKVYNHVISISKQNK